MFLTILGKALSLIFPDYCVVCSKPPDLLCLQCQKGLISTLPQCYICRKLSSGSVTHLKCSSQKLLISATVLWQYNKTAKHLLKTYKYTRIQRVSALINHLIDQELSRKQISFTDVTAIVPVPLHFRKSNKRGFNQLDQIGEHLARKHKAKYIPDLLIRKINSKKQAGLSNAERYLNLRDAFLITPTKRKDLSSLKSILIIDDVVTSGATLEECAKAILTVAPHIQLHALALFRGNTPRSHPQPS